MTGSVCSHVTAGYSLIDNNKEGNIVEKTLL